MKVWTPRVPPWSEHKDVSREIPPISVDFVRFHREWRPSGVASRQRGSEVEPGLRAKRSMPPSVTYPRLGGGRWLLSGGRIGRGLRGSLLVAFCGFSWCTSHGVPGQSADASRELRVASLRGILIPVRLGDLRAAADEGRPRRRPLSPSPRKCAKYDFGAVFPCLYIQLRGPPACWALGSGTSVS